MTYTLYSEIVAAAVVVRDRQKRYFKDRSRENLIASKEAERILDDLLTRLDTATKGEMRG